jgi:hypothetical protein
MCGRRPLADPFAARGRHHMERAREGNVLRDMESNRWSHTLGCSGTMLVWLWVRVWID